MGFRFQNHIYQEKVHIKRSEPILCAITSITTPYVIMVASLLLFVFAPEWGDYDAIPRHRHL